MVTGGERYECFRSEWCPRVLGPQYDRLVCETGTMPVQTRCIYTRVHFTLVVLLASARFDAPVGWSCPIRCCTTRIVLMMHTTSRDVPSKSAVGLSMLPSLLSQPSRVGHSQSTASQFPRLLRKHFFSWHDICYCMFQPLLPFSLSRLIHVLWRCIVMNKLTYLLQLPALAEGYEMRLFPFVDQSFSRSSSTANRCTWLCQARCKVSKKNRLPAEQHFKLKFKV